MSEGGVREAIFFSSGFAVSSSLLVVINKWALANFKYGATLTAIQFAFSALITFALGATGVVEVDPLESKKVIAFMPAVCMFYISVATNLKLLEVANVDTYIVVRSLVPIFTLALEMAYLKQPWPGIKTAGSLVLIFLGACAYVADGYKTIYWGAYSYALMYLIAFTIDQVLIKKIVTDVKLTRWGLVYYNNLLALVLMPAGVIVTGEYRKLFETVNSGEFSAGLAKTEVQLPVAMSCLFGLSISFFALNCRKALTATAFTVLGVVCKFGTVFVNTVVWDNHASTMGIFYVCICLSGGILFQQFQGTQMITPAKKVEKQEKFEDIENEPLKTDDSLVNKKDDNQ